VRREKEGPVSSKGGRRAPRRVRVADAVALRSAVRVGRRPSGGAVSRAGVVADRGVVWPVLGTALLCAPPTRRAGAAGLAAVGCSSVVTNTLKLTVRRRRPPAPLRLGARTAGRSPTTWSFPSGHTASAFAFGVAGAVAQPLAGTSLVPLALAVAASRLTTARHHPSDVAAGVGIGCAVGIAVGVSVRRLAARRAAARGPADRG
jgi:membrane-associated phospholipid phosphatase